MQRFKTIEFLSNWLKLTFFPNFKKLKESKEFPRQLYPETFTQLPLKNVYLNQEGKQETIADA